MRDGIGFENGPFFRLFTWYLSDNFGDSKIQFDELYNIKYMKYNECKIIDTVIEWEC